MLDVTGHPSFGTKIDGIIFITRRGEFAHKTYYLRSFISRQTFLEIIQLLDQVDISINESLSGTHPSKKAYLQEDNMQFPSTLKNKPLIPQSQKDIPNPTELI